jgi:ABC-type oligopeptide transport system ATPase subunit
MTPILSARAVTKSFIGGRRQGWRRETIRAVDAVDLDVHEGETLAVVGESGSGKSTLARVLLGLSAPTSGDVLFRGRTPTALTRQDRHVFRREIQPVFQDPAASLNPRMRIETTLAHVLLRHRLATAQTLRAVIIAQLEAVGLVPGDHYLGRYPHELSGGQQQRVAIARALAVRPKLLIADEPLSSLDMSVQAQVLDLLIELRRRFHLGLVLISHDLNVVETIADRIAVMYLGKIVETGATVEVMRRPQHAYTRTLLNARLVADPRLARRQRMNEGIDHG